MLASFADGTTQYRSTPVQVPGLSNVRAFEAQSHFLALKDDGTVWAWGKNNKGQLGDGTKTDRYVPAQVVGLTNVIKISAGDEGSLALRSDGTVWVWGYTCCGAAGNGINPRGELDPETYHLVPTQVHNLDRVIAIAAGYSHHMALRADGTVWTWGFGDHGENGTGLLTQQVLPVQVPGLDQVVAIATRKFFSLALKADGTVWAWGNNGSGQLGVNGLTYSAVPIQVPGLSDIVAISASWNHVLAMRRDGTVLAWGWNDNGQLGDGTLQDRTEPRAVLAPGGSGQLNLLTPAPTSFNRLPSAQISLSVNSGTAPLTLRATAINASDPDGTITAYFWKSGDGQQASGASANFVFAQAGTYNIDLLIEDNAGGRGRVRQQVVVAPAAAVGVSTNSKIGVSHQGSVALTNDGRILAWGRRFFLGLYDNQAQSLLPDMISHPIASGVTGAVDVAIGDSTIHALLADGTVVGWGGNTSGQVGSGTNVSTISQPQRLPGLPPVHALAAYGDNYLALTRDGRVFSWGSNGYGQLGLGDYENRFAPTEIAGLDTVTSIATGPNLSVALKGDGSVWAWGNNQCYQLGDGTQISRNRPIQIPGLADITKIFVTYNNVFALKADGTVWITGCRAALPGDPGFAAGARHVSAYDGIVQIAGDYRHVIALKADGTVWTGGQQSSMALGFGNGEDIVGLRQLPGIADAIWVAGASNLSMVARRDGTVLAWGANNLGRLGDGTLALRQTPALVVNETVNGPLDLAPEVANNIPQNLIPPFFLATYSSGSLSSISRYADLRGIIPSGTFASESDFGRFAAGYNVYVAASVPTGVGPVLVQLDSGNSWSLLRWPMAEFLRGVALDSETSLVRAQILQNADLSSPQLAGTSILVGYGTDPDEMLRSARYRTIFTVTQQ